MKIKEMICIACPRGCLLKVSNNDNGLKVSGNQCPKGEKYGIQEYKFPMRILTTTVKTSFKDKPRLPVRLSEAVPLSKIFDYMESIKRISLKTNIKPGDIVARNLLDSEVDLIATGEITNEK